MKHSIIWLSRSSFKLKGLWEFPAIWAQNLWECVEIPAKIPHRNSSPAHVEGTQWQRQQTITKHHWTTSMFDCREGVLLLEGLILFSVNIEMVRFTHLPSGHSSISILACSGKLQSGFLMSVGGVLMDFSYHITPFLWVFDRWCKLLGECAGARNCHTLCLKVIFNLVAADRSAFSTIRIVPHCDLLSSLLMWLCPVLLATMPWTLNILLTWSMVERGISRSLELHL